MTAKRSVAVRVGIPTVLVAVLATAVMIAVNIATTDTTTGPKAWAAVGVATLASAAASFWLYRRAQPDDGDTAEASPAATAPTTNPVTAADVSISNNTFHGPSGVQGSGVQNNRFGA